MKNEYVIITDSTIDMTQEMADKLDLKVIPLTFLMDQKEYENHLDGREISSKDFYDLMRTGKKVTTAALNSSNYTEMCEPFLEEGKDILILAFSSGLSTTYQSSLTAVSELSEKYPDRKIITVDSTCASMGFGLLCYLAVQQKNAEKNIDECCEYVKSIIPNLCHWVTVDDLNNLKRSGRISATTALVGSAIGIKPIIHMDDEGHLVNVTKVRGRVKSIEFLLDKLTKTGINPSEQVVFISHADCLEDAELLAKLIKEKHGVKEVHISYIGPVIGSHIGPSTIALFFLGQER